MQALLQGLIQRRYGLSSPPMLINGKVLGDHRKRRADDFNSRQGFDVMILSPRAGGVGLTLTAANHVIYLSRWWNPAVEDQCSDRVHRIGQSKTVHIYYPLAVHPEYGESSFDLLLDGLISRKRRLNQTMLASPAMTQDNLNLLYRQTVHHAAEG